MISENRLKAARNRDFREKLTDFALNFCIPPHENPKNVKNRKIGHSKRNLSKSLKSNNLTKNSVKNQS